MITINATNARNDWSSVLDSVVREKPKLIKRTRDYVFFSNISVIESFLSEYRFSAEEFIEDDGSVTISLNEIDLVENGIDEKDAKHKLANAILEYAEDFYREFSLWANAPNRKSHIPYIFKALIINDAAKIGGLIQCRRGKR